MHYRALYAFHLVYFVVFSSTTFLPKYFGELGMSDAQIGMLMSLPAIAGVLTQPFFGALTDRVRLKKYVVIGLLAALSVSAFILDSLTGFLPIMLGLTLFYILHLPIAPAYTAISLEYTREIRRPYGPIRLMGTVGYQLGALLIGVILATSLQGLFRLIGVVLVASCALSCLMPPVRGHQHGTGRVRIGTLLRDKHLVALLVMVLIGTITSQFYMSFFSKHLGDLGVDNTMTGILLFLSVLLEIPFLLFADKLSRRTSIWNWILIGFGLNALRWVGLALSKSIVPLLIFQLPGVSIMACFEFFPSLYINRRVSDALQGSAQMALMIVSFGIAKVIGSLLGGFVAGWVGIPAVFAFNGVALVIAIALFFRPTRRWIREDALEQQEP